MPDARREAAFRAKHGMSSGAYYEMRRKAERGGIGRAAFDRAARTIPGYKSIKRVLQGKREIAKAKAAGKDTQRAMNRLKDFIGDLPPDIEVGWGTP